ncbi:MAG: hypothetical protein GPJ54_06325 [Candidatus Heimdallarchaeota archaeon]|nr:hypothetical protein [Candidatus Heimdallarchaeota archaeon]
MSTSFETLNGLLKSYDMTVADLEYIVRYLTNEKISPQLAMRRIKSFEALKTKLEDTSSQETITDLEAKLKNKDKLLEDELAKKDIEVKKILDEKTSIEDKKKELENLSDLFDSERDELRNQLKLMQEMQEEIIVDDSGSTSSESGSTLLESIARFQIDLQELIREKSELQSYIFPLTEVLQHLIDDPQNYNFNQNKYITHLPVAAEKSKISQPIQKVSEIKTTSISSTMQKSVIGKKTEVKKIKPGPSEKVLQILNLFLDFVGEAKTDKDFRNRVETVCDMDEAYEHLGGIGLSQLYSFASKDLSKKDELITLIDAWKIDGVPR